MRRFSALYNTLDQTQSTNAKVAVMVDYFQHSQPADLAYAVFFLSGRRLRRLVGAAKLRHWLGETSELPAWLVEQTYADVGDLAETIALLLADREESAPLTDVSLAGFVVEQLLPLGQMDEDEQRSRVVGWWCSLPYQDCYLVNKLLTGALRVGVSQGLVATALAQVAELPRPVILHRLMGQWTPDAAFARMLLSEDDGQTSLSRPYPFCLASPLENAPGELSADAMADRLGPVSDYQIEWKWDGIRGQLIRRAGQTFLWSRGEDLITPQFPEIVAASESLADGTVLDGEILAWRDGQPMPFSALQRRFGRKKPGKKSMADFPCIFRCYDLLELDGCDQREQPLSARRADLERLAATFPERLALSQTVAGETWQALALLRADARRRRVEGFMLKHHDSRYVAGRKRGVWWKWKIEPFTVDAVMLYAQAGHGRRANLHTDYTFAVWRGDELVPIAKAYSGLNNDEINALDKWIRRHTRERFGPVRSVEPVQVFELAFEAIARSSRHKSGVALRFPRIRRWRKDLAAKDADSLETLEALI
ncbi:MAG: ATP-dependent DNA ligase [Pseudomonadota bacterium]